MERLVDISIPDRRNGSSRRLSCARQGRARLHNPSDRYLVAEKLSLQLSAALELCHAPR